MGVAHPHKPLGPQHGFDGGRPRGWRRLPRRLVLRHRQPPQHQRLQPLRMEGCTPGVHEAANAEALRCGGFLPVRTAPLPAAVMMVVVVVVRAAALRVVVGLSAVVMAARAALLLFMRTGCTVAAGWLVLGLGGALGLGAGGSHSAAVVALDVEAAHHGVCLAAEHLLQRHPPLHARDHRGKGIEGGHDGAKLVQLPLLQQIGLVEQHVVRTLQLLHQEIHYGAQVAAFPQLRAGHEGRSAGVVSQEGAAVQHGDQALKPHPLHQWVSRCGGICETIADGVWLCHPRVLQHQPVKRNAPLVGQVHQLLQRIKQLVFDGAACTSISELDGVGQVCGGIELLVAPAVAVIANKLRVNIDGGHIVHDDPELHVGLVLQQVPQQRSLAAPQKAGDHADGHPGIDSGAITIGALRAFHDAACRAAP
mmetsp:Transcript_18625/g.56233  ORF Transcript_18625/g.56233 Transcript_18625/m.56233 type:complete len:421 (+) Transcript_18625:781-2043(+)